MKKLTNAKGTEVTSHPVVSKASMLSMFFPEFKSLSETELEDAAQYFKQVVFEKNEIILMEGEKSKMLYFLTTGKVSAINYQKDGRPFISHIYQASSFFAECSLEDSPLPLPFDLISMEHSKALRIEVEDFWQLLEKHPKLYRVFMSSLAKKNLEQNQKISLLAIPDAYSRVEKALILIHQKDPLKRAIQMRHEDIGNFCYVSRETTTRMISKLIEAGAIEVDGRLITPKNSVATQ
ncbi:Crp/Fnr family transcriptional regulator [Candidatus Falkowbacteria bacterium]|nr:Crp/Fnr family transcriptional regulator [Candidatus Falkowbacteria bacterium]